MSNVIDFSGYDSFDPGAYDDEEYFDDEEYDVSIKKISKKINKLIKKNRKLILEMNDLKKDINDELERVITFNSHDYYDDHNVFYYQLDCNKKMMSYALNDFEICRLLGLLKRLDTIKFDKCNEKRLNLIF